MKARMIARRGVSHKSFRSAGRFVLRERSSINRGVDSVGRRTHSKRLRHGKRKRRSLIATSIWQIVRLIKNSNIIRRHRIQK